MKHYFLYILGLVFFMLSSCTPKMNEVASSSSDETENKVDLRPTPCTMLSDLANSEDIQTEYVLYKDYMKVEDYDAAYEHWLRAFSAAPGANGRVQYQFEDGVRLYKYLFKKEEDRIVRGNIVDSIHQIYMLRISCFGQEGEMMARLGYDYYRYFDDYITEDSIFSCLRKALDLCGKKTPHYAINPFTKLLFEQYNKGNINSETANHYISVINTILIYGPSNCKSDCQYWPKIEEYTSAIFELFERFEDFYSSEYYFDKYYTIFLNDSTNCENIRDIHRKLKWGKCDEDMMEMTKLQNLVNTTCFVPPPTASILKEAYAAYNNGNYSDAVQHFDTYIKSTDDYEKKAKYSLITAKIYYKDIRNFETSRTYALKAAKFKSNWGEPYILIGKLYASSGPLCGPGRGWDSQVVVWAAIDKFQYARDIDPSVRQEANKWIKNYERYMPSKNEIFLRLYSIHDKYYVSCWIKEWTKIRPAP